MIRQRFAFGREYKAAALRTSAAQDAEDQAIVQYGPHSEQRFAAGLLVKERGAEEDTAETAVGMNESTTLPAIVVQLRLLAEMILVSVPEYAPLCLKVLAAVERMAGMEADPYLERYGVGEA